MPDFSILQWVYPQLPVISDITWRPAWPTNLSDLPYGCFRLADDSVGMITSEGEATAKVSVYIDTWAVTPELRDAYDTTVNLAMQTAGLYRHMKRHTEELRPDGVTSAYRSTTLYAGEYDHSEARMYAP